VDNRIEGEKKEARRRVFFDGLGILIKSDGPQIYPVFSVGNLVHCTETGNPSVFVKILVQLKFELNSLSAERNYLRYCASPESEIETMVRHSSHG